MQIQEAMALRSKITGVLLKNARTRAGKSQKDCAKILGCSPRTISDYEYGRRDISLPELEALARRPLPVVACSQRIARSGALAAGSGDPAGAEWGSTSQRGDYPSLAWADNSASPFRKEKPLLAKRSFARIV